MYDELVKRLRNAAKMSEALAVLLPHSEGNATAKLYNEAADAIEELAAFKAQVTDGHFYCMRDGVLYEAKVDPPKGKVFHLPQIEFPEPPKEEKE